MKQLLLHDQFTLSGSESRKASESRIELLQVGKYATASFAALAPTDWSPDPLR